MDLLQWASTTGWSTQEGVAHPYHLKRPSPPVAVLTGQYTASSGEAIVVAFHARLHTQSFGLPIGSAGDPVVKAALTWLQLQPPCQS